MRGWSILFWCAAAFNLVIGLAIMLMPALSNPAADPATLLPLRGIGWFVAVFGIGYAIVASDPPRHHGVVKIGLIGKLGFVLMMLAAWMSGEARTGEFLTSLLDLPWVVAFFLFLHRGAKA